MNTEKWEKVADHFIKWIEEPKHGVIAAVGVVTFLIAFLIFISLVPGWALLIILIIVGYKFWLRLWVEFRKSQR